MEKNAKKKGYTAGVLMVIIGGVMWGCSGTSGQYLFSHSDLTTLDFTCYRELLAGVLLLAWCLLRKDPGIRGIWKDRKDVLQLVCYSFFGLIMVQFAYMNAISYSNAGTATVLQNLGAVLIMLLTCLKEKRYPGRKELLSLFLAVLGTWLIATGGNPAQMLISPQGLLWGLLTACGVVAYTLIPMRIISKWGAKAVLAWGLIIGGGALTIAVRPWMRMVPLTAMDWAAAAVVILFGTVLAFNLYLSGANIIGPVKASMLATTEPLTATLLSFALLGTRFALGSLLGFACILATVLLLAKPESSSERIGKPVQEAVRHRI